MIAERKLYRSRAGNMLGGVCAGLANYLNVDVTLLRILFVLAAIFGFHGILIYLIFWIITPLEA